MPKKRKVLKKWVRMLFLTTIIVVAIASVFVIMNGLNNIKNKRQ